MKLRSIRKTDLRDFRSTTSMDLALDTISRPSDGSVLDKSNALLWPVSTTFEAIGDLNCLPCWISGPTTISGVFALIACILFSWFVNNLWRGSALLCIVAAAMIYVTRKRK